MYVFNVYGDIIIKQPDNIYAEHSATIKITVIPVNAFGWKIPFRKSDAEFVIIKGESIVEIIEENRPQGFITLHSKGIPGIVEISVKSRFSLFPNLVTFEIFALTG